MTDEMENTVAALRQRAPFTPKVGVVLGSGLGGLAGELQEPRDIPYGEIPGFVRPTTPGHAGRLIFGRLEGVSCVMMQGRFHHYEGYSPQQLVYPIRAMAALGVSHLLLTNAAGGVNLGFRPGDLMLIDDHINFAGVNPLIGPNEERLGPRFPDMSNAYDSRFRALIDETARELCVPLRHGVYAMMCGPSFETPAEIRMLRALGVDAVGMSTVPEVIAANHCGLRTAAISCITNMAAGILPRPLTHEEVVETGRLAAEKFGLLVRHVVGALRETSGER
jgi:purine-nucleoside phosphorylase